MELMLYQIDAFANKVFEGNPAAICPLKKWLNDDLMQTIAAENNLSETAFFVQHENIYYIRWFTPTTEVNLCGHATLAAAYVIFEIMGDENNSILFASKSGELQVTKKGLYFEMDFPAQPANVCNMPQELASAFKVQPIACLKSEDYIVVFEKEEDVVNAKADMFLLTQLDLRGVAITSLSKQYDFITRFFAPRYGINEDPVTGSAFTQLAPYWAQRLNKTKLSAKQVSSRGGEVLCVVEGKRIKISGRAVLYMTATINVSGSC